MYIAKNLEQYRLSENMSQGEAFPASIAFGPNAGLLYYVPSNTTDREISDQSTLIIESGGHYYGKHKLILHLRCNYCNGFYLQMGQAMSCGHSSTVTLQR